MVNKDLVATKDQLGKRDSVVSIIIPEYTETFIQEDGPSHWFLTDKGTAFIIGHSDNGEIGASTGLTIGSSGLGTPTLTEVHSSNKKFIWNFREGDSSLTNNGYYTTYSITDTSNSTASEDTSTNYRVDFTSGQYWQSRPLYLTQSGANCTQAKFTVVSTGTIALTARANSAASFENVTSGSWHLFTTPGKEVKLKITESGASTAMVTKIIMEYLLEGD